MANYFLSVHQQIVQLYWKRITDVSVSKLSHGQFGRTLCMALLTAAVPLVALTHVSGAQAAPITFNYTGALQQWTVTTSGTYSFVVNGAQGGNSSNGTTPGGNGARVAGHIYLPAGSTLAIVVGGQGGSFFSAGGGGGGGSFVYIPGVTPTLLAAAGGGGGAGASTPGLGGLAVINGGASVLGRPGGTAGSGGSGGTVVGSGGGGAGWLSNGVAGSGANSGTGGNSYPSFAVAGSNNTGGYGGGGQGGGSAGGGGGGYSGGGGENGEFSNSAGGGGGSFLDAAFLAPTILASTNLGNGSVEIDFLPESIMPVPTLSTWGMILLSVLLGLGVLIAWRRRMT